MHKYVFIYFKKYKRVEMCLFLAQHLWRAVSSRLIVVAISQKVMNAV